MIASQVFPNHFDDWGTAHDAQKDVPLAIQCVKSQEEIEATTSDATAYRGLALVLVASICFSCSNLCVFLLSTLPEPRIPSVQTSCVRFLFQFGLTALSICIFRYEKLREAQTWLGKKGNAWKLFYRGAWGVCGLSGWFASLSVMSFSDATAIVFTNVALTGVFAHFLLGEKFLPSDILAAVGGLIGVLLIAQPTQLFGGTAGGAASRPIAAESVILGLATACCSSMAYISARRIGPGEDFLVTTLWFAGMGVLVTPFLVLLVAGSFVASTVPAATYLQVGAGFLGWIGQLFLNSGLARAPSGPASVMRYAELVIALVVQSTLLGDAPNAFKWLGSVLILSSVISTLYRQTKLRAEKLLTANIDRGDEPGSKISREG